MEDLKIIVKYLEKHEKEFNKLDDHVKQQICLGILGLIITQIQITCAEIKFKALKLKYGIK